MIVVLMVSDDFGTEGHLGAPICQGEQRQAKEVFDDVMWLVVRSLVGAFLLKTSTNTLSLDGEIIILCLIVH